MEFTNRKIPLWFLLLESPFSSTIYTTGWFHTNKVSSATDVWPVCSEWWSTVYNGYHYMERKMKVWDSSWDDLGSGNDKWCQSVALLVWAAQGNATWENRTAHPYAESVCVRAMQKLLSIITCCWDCPSRWWKVTWSWRGWNSLFPVLEVTPLLPSIPQSLHTQKHWAAAMSLGRWTSEPVPAWLKGDKELK